MAVVYVSVSLWYDVGAVVTHNRCRLLVKLLLEGSNAKRHAEEVVGITYPGYPSASRTYISYKSGNAMTHEAARTHTRTVPTEPMLGHEGPPRASGHRLAFHDEG